MHCKDHAEANVNLEVVGREVFTVSTCITVKLESSKNGSKCCVNRGNITWMFASVCVHVNRCHNQ